MATHFPPLSKMFRFLHIYMYTSTHLHYNIHVYKTNGIWIAFEMFCFSWFLPLFGIIYCYHGNANSATVPKCALHMYTSRRTCVPSLILVKHIRKIKMLLLPKRKKVWWNSKMCVCVCGVCLHTCMLRGEMVEHDGVGWFDVGAVHKGTNHVPKAGLERDSDPFLIWKPDFTLCELCKALSNRDPSRKPDSEDVWAKSSFGTWFVRVHFGNARWSYACMGQSVWTAQ